MEKHSILLISFEHFDRNLIDKTVKEISSAFGYNVRYEEFYRDISGYFDPARRQYDGNKLLKLIHSDYKTNDADKILGLFTVDLFIPILTYIFGQAVFKGNAGVVSIYRLRNELYGIKGDDVILQDRLVKVVIHELGHIFGLVHCYIPDCVMRPSTYVEEIDQKGNTFCPKCRAELESAISI